MTGASHGIGRSLSLMLAQKGYSVIACARRKGELEALSNENKLIIPFAMDITKKEDIEDFQDFLGTRKVDVLINCAGGNHVENKFSFINETSLDMLELFAKNTSGTFDVIRSVRENMLKSESPVILVFTSASGHTFDHDRGSYSIAKKAESMMTRYVRQALSIDKIRVTEMLIALVDSGHPVDKESAMTLEEIQYVVNSVIEAPINLNFDVISLTNITSPPRI